MLKLCRPRENNGLAPCLLSNCLVSPHPPCRVIVISTRRGGAYPSLPSRSKFDAARRGPSPSCLGSNFDATRRGMPPPCHVITNSARQAGVCLRHVFASSSTWRGWVYPSCCCCHFDAAGRARPSPSSFTCPFDVARRVCRQQ